MAVKTIKKPDCYKCMYRGTIPGDAHSRCKHPKAKTADDSIVAMINSFAGKTGETAKRLGIKGNPIGIRGGWFMWPVNFDPAWLEKCNGFTEKPRA